MCKEYTVLNKIKAYIKNPYKIFVYFASKDFFSYMEDELYLKLMFRALIGKKLNLKKPQTFNEKLQWLKLYDRQMEYVHMVDKFEAKQYVAERIGAQYIIPTFGIWDRFEDIKWDNLPNQFVLKCTHDSGGLIICKDKKNLNKKNAKNILEKSLSRNYYYWGREWPYKNLKPRIIAEEYMIDDGDGLADYKFMCFNGEVKCSFVCSGRFSDKGLHVTFFDRDWNVMPFERYYPSYKQGLPKPQSYEKMIELAEKLSEGIPFLRVDFYELSGEIYFGELTFYPGSGFEEFTPLEWDYKIGNWIRLPERIK